MSGYTLINEGSRDAGLAALDMARRAGMSVSVDCASSAPLERTGAEPFLEWTQSAKLLFANADQAKVLTGRDDPDAAAKVLTAWFPQVVIKLDAEGALWYTNGRPEPIRVAGRARRAGGRRHRRRRRLHRRASCPPGSTASRPAEALANGCRLAAEAISHLGARPRL